MKRLFLIAILSLPARSYAADMPDTVLEPTFLIQRAINSLNMEGGTTSNSVARALQDCMANQGNVNVHMAGQSDMCPPVTAALKAREDATKAEKNEAPK